MQIHAEVHNYMETLVGQELAENQYSERYDQEKLADLACLTLAQLRPVYIRYDIDFLSSLPETKLVALKQDVVVALQNAETMLAEDRRREREEPVAIVYAQSRYQDEGELEWFEKPIVSKALK
ncbi:MULTISPECIES: late competence development ComFB family protein [unclassified Vibrio]|uniref:Late competence development ComFB family protein n=1 Tax=Vibrio sp. HB236076 TaxID=3232307 RepID=A0AB39HKQ5_9VIBR|nr:late competence development ComFB family protein [Vibrio sp. HB161653]MDP5252969.1 late competence development ComFB family protein [Vibrio sp. HB161653]